MNFPKGYSHPCPLDDSLFTDFMDVTFYFDTHNFVYSGPLKFRNTPISNGPQFWATPRPQEKTLLIIAVDETKNCNKLLPEVHSLVTDIVRELGTKYSNFGQVMIVRFGDKNFQFAPSQCSGSIGVFRRGGRDQFFVKRRERPYFSTEESGCRLTNGELVPYENIFVS